MANLNKTTESFISSTQDTFLADDSGMQFKF